jgi:hypothetical protein
MTKAKPLPPAELLRLLFDYNKSTGQLVWLNPLARRTKKGAIAGTVNSRNYIQIKIDGKLFLAHRLIWAIVHGSIQDDMQIDHINGNTLDNRIDNLRLCTSTENNANRRAHIRNKSGYKGVSWDKNKQKWLASIMANRVFYRIGFFDDPKLAHIAYCKAASELHGNFARIL